MPVNLSKRTTNLGIAPRRSIEKVVVVGNATVVDEVDETVLPATLVRRFAHEVDVRQRNVVVLRRMIGATNVDGTVANQLETHMIDPDVARPLQRDTVAGLDDVRVHIANFEISKDDL